MYQSLLIWVKKRIGKAYILALIISAPLAFYLLSNISQYEIMLVEEYVMGENRFNLWDDFDGDGISESLSCYPWNKNFYALPIVRNNFECDYQTNVKGSFGKIAAQSIYIGDYDNNNKKEIYTISNIGDSLMLNIVEPYGIEDIVKNRFVCLVNNGKAGRDYTIQKTTLIDIDNDGTKEFVFAIFGGFCIKPRSIYIYNINSDKLISSGHLGCSIYDFYLSDINNDNKPEFILSTGACGNMTDTIRQYHDHNAYSFAFDTDLKPIFKPHIHHGFTNQSFLYPFDIDDKRYWLNCVRQSSKLAEKGTNFYLLNYKGESIKHKHIKYTDKNQYLSLWSLVINGQNSVLVFNDTHEIEIILPDLETVKFANLKERVSRVRFYEELNNDGEKEFLFVSRDYKKVIVYNNNFRKHTTLDINFQISSSRVIFNKIIGKYSDPAFSLQSDNHYYEFIYKKTKLFYLKFFGLLSVIYLSILLLVVIIQKITSVSENRRKRLAELQLSNWKNQLDPHFTFNTLNSVGSVILNEDRNKAYDFFSRFAKLVRYALECSNKVTVTIEDEINFIDLYLQLEQFRFNNKFDYKIEISEDVNKKHHVPKMIMQTYVENAVRHGLMDRENGSLLTIKITINNKSISINIVDNGIGRIASARKKRLSNGIGMKAMKEYFDLINSMNRNKISVLIKDNNKTDLKYPGTTVQIIIPLKMSYKF